MKNSSSDSTQERNANNNKYLYLTALAVSFLFFGYLWGNQTKTGELTIGDKGLVIKIADHERVEKLIDNILDPSIGADGKKPKNSEEARDLDYQRQSLIDHLALLIKKYDHNSYMGKKLLGIAEESVEPFSWDYERVSIEYDPTVNDQQFRICANRSDWRNRRLSVQIRDLKADEFTPDGKEYYVYPILNCTPTNLKRVLTSNMALAQASRMPGRLAQARAVVTIPK